MKKLLIMIALIGTAPLGAMGGSLYSRRVFWQDKALHEIFTEKMRALRVETVDDKRFSAITFEEMGALLGVPVKPSEGADQDSFVFMATLEYTPFLFDDVAQYAFFTLQEDDIRALHAGGVVVIKRESVFGMAYALYFKEGILRYRYGSYMTLQDFKVS